MPLVRAVGMIKSYFFQIKILKMRKTVKFIEAHQALI